jgi:hypothetical protein
MHLDYVLSCRVIAAERRRVLARMLHEPDRASGLRPQADQASGLGPQTSGQAAAVMRLEGERARFRAHASALHARLATSRLFATGELAALRDRLVDAVAAIDAAAGIALAAGRDGAQLAAVGRQVAEPHDRHAERGDARGERG